ncbi:MAG: NUDIX domain-containing protein [Bacteroidia bacterium]|nr:NUDIX domain-containing protein [Bacteroidia bacterium]
MTKLIDKLAWIEIQDGKILSTLSKGKKLFYIPGGKREAGESDHEALIREIKEELSVDLHPESLRYLGTFEAQADGKDEGVLVRMTCYTGSYKGELQPDHEIEKIVWLDYLEKEKIAPVDKIIFDYLNFKGLL